MSNQFPTPSDHRIDSARQHLADLACRFRQAEAESDLWKQRYATLEKSALLLAVSLVAITATLIILAFKTI